MLNRTKALIRNYFGFSQRETNGFLALLLLMLACLAIPSVYDALLPEYDPAADQKLLNEIVAQLELEEEARGGYPSNAAPIVEGKTPTAPFNPNEITVEEWQKMGLSPKLAQRIKNYQAKGGTFRVKEDVAKIYGFPEDVYQRIYPFIGLPDRKTFMAERNSARTLNNEPHTPNPYKTTHPNYTSYKKAPLQLFDINKADTTQLRRIKGIGSKRAQWIVNYRNKLGGFTSTAQIGEVYGLDSAVVDSVRKYTYVTPGYSPKPIYINTITVDELGRHPYFNFKIAKAVVAYREQHGSFQKAEDLLKVKLMKPEVLQKARPYLQY